MRSSEFDNYIVYHEEQTNRPEKVVINCFYENKTVGYIYFVQGEVADPEIFPNGTMKLYFPFSRFREIMETLRYEKPLYISIYGTKSVVSTVKEPVGEQEGVPYRKPE